MYIHISSHVCIHIYAHVCTHSDTCTHMFASIRHMPMQLCDHICLCVHHKHVSPNILSQAYLKIHPGPLTTHMNAHTLTADSRAHSWLLTFIHMTTHITCFHVTTPPSHTLTCVPALMFTVLTHICTLTILTVMHTCTFCFSCAQIPP